MIEDLERAAIFLGGRESSNSITVQNFLGETFLVLYKEESSKWVVDSTPQRIFDDLLSLRGWLCGKKQKK